MDVFCNSTFWNINDTWYTENPRLSPCFQKTVLVWVPCLFLWLFSPMELFFILRSKSRNIPWNWLNISKLIFTGILFVLSAIEIGHFSRKSYDDISDADFFAPIVKAVTFVLAILLVICNRRSGLRTSGVLFLFWLLLSLCGAVQFHHELTVPVNGKDHTSFTYITYIEYYIVVLAMLLLNCFGDAPPSSSAFQPGERPSTEKGASFLNKMFFLWFEPIPWMGFRKPLEEKDLCSINPEDSASEIVRIFDKYLKKSSLKDAKDEYPKASFRKTSGTVTFTSGKKEKKCEFSVVPVLLREFGFEFSCLAALSFIQDGLIYTSPLLLKLLIGFVDSEEYLWKGYMYSAAMFIVISLKSLIYAQYYFGMFTISLRVRTAVISLIYRKALCLSNTARKESSMGEVVNLMSVDAERFREFFPYVNILWSAPFQVSLALYFLWDIIGPSVFAGLAVMLLMFPIHGTAATKLKALHTKLMKKKRRESEIDE